MISYYAKHSVHEEFQLLKTPRLEDVWVYGDKVTTDELSDVATRHQLNYNIVRDVLDRDELPRVEYSDDTAYVFLQTISRTKHGQAITSPLLAVVRPDMFATLAPVNILTPDMVAGSNASIRGTDTPTLLLNSLAAIVADYESSIRHTGRYIKDTGNRLRTHDVNNADFVHFVTIEDNLNEYQMSLGGMLSVAERLRENRHKLFVPNDIEALEDVIQYMQQLLVAVASHGQSITSIRNSYSTIANNTLNMRMKTLTMLTVLIALPNVFYGMYGMNIDLPFQNEPWAYAALMGFTITVLVVIAYVAFRKRFF